MTKITVIDPLKVLLRFKDLQILVIGDVMLDHYTWGEVVRISPEAPVPVVHVRNETFTAGGAANVAMNLAALGVKTRLLSTWGDDESGLRLSSLLAAKSIDFAQSIRDRSIQTIVKKRIIARTQQVCRIDYEGPRNMYEFVKEDMDSLIASAALGCDAIILSDYAKGVLNQTFVNRIEQFSKKNNIPVAIDPKPSCEIKYSEPLIITPNRTEALLLSGIEAPPYGTSFPLDVVCDQIHRVVSPKLLVVTLGADGMAVSEKGKKTELMPTMAREVFDVSGAGDTVIAVITSAIVSGADLKIAAFLANAAAGCVVGHMGTVPVELHELNKALSNLEFR